jgi:hypothetical protein
VKTSTVAKGQNGGLLDVGTDGPPENQPIERTRQAAAKADSSPTQQRQEDGRIEGNLPASQSGDLDDSKKLHAEVLQEELGAYRRLETWGASLFFGGIGLVAKQLIEWDLPAAPAKKVALHSWAFMTPALLGLVAFIFLRIVNFRCRDVAKRLFDMLGANRVGQKRGFGFLGWSLAMMPLLLGYAVSLGMATGAQDRLKLFVLLTWIGAFTVIASFVWHLKHLGHRLTLGRRKKCPPLPTAP